MHWTGKVEEVAFTVFGRDVAWYGIIITTSMLIGLGVAMLLCKKLKLKSDDLLEMFLIAIPIAVIGARVGYVLFHPYSYYILSHPFTWDDFVNMLAIWDGGLTITTGAPCGILGGLLWAKRNKIDFLAVADTIVCVIILCQGIGRWGNFFNQELFGNEVTEVTKQYFPYAIYIKKMLGWYQATFFYESMADIAGFVLLYMVSRRLKVRGSGIVNYAIVYGTIRAIMESMRIDSVVGEVHYAMYPMIAIAVVATGVLVYLIITQHKKYGRVWYGNGIPLDLYKPAKLLADGVTGVNSTETKVNNKILK